MSLSRLLIANRGEIAVRIARAASDAGMTSVAVFSEDDAASPHIRCSDAAVALPGRGPAAYLDPGRIVAAALQAGCDALHPGYGFLSESAALARCCAASGLVFVGPAAEALELFGDKARARAFARSCDVPVAEGTHGATTLAQAQAFFAALAPGAGVMVKALAGGGGRGMRAVSDPAGLAEAFARCAAEAEAAFGDGALYVERLLRQARHIEIQVLGDGSGEVVQLGARECSLQRRHQKLVEIAPAPGLPPGLGARLAAAALRLAAATRYRGLGTFEFLVAAAAEEFVFIEANPRLQVEHTVTEEIYGLDLVRLQLAIAGGATLAALGLRQDSVPPPRGCAVQVRVNMERMLADGTAMPTGGRITRYEPATGPGIRVDGWVETGYQTVTGFDTLLVKLVAYAPGGGLADALNRLLRALGDCRIEGVETNLGFLAALLRRPEVAAGQITTQFVAEQMAALLAAADRAPAAALPPEAEADADADAELIRSPMSGVVRAVLVQEGMQVAAGAALLVVEAMKMELVIRSDRAGMVSAVLVAPAASIEPGRALLVIAPGAGAAADAAAAAPDLDAIRPDLAEVIERHRLTGDAARPAAVRRRHELGRRTARETVAALCDPGSFLEYGALAIPAQRSRRPAEELRRSAPADGLIAGLGSVNAAAVGAAAARCAVLAYDYSVLAGTQGIMSHRKMDRLLQRAADHRLPVVLFAEGGGGRPGDVDHLGVSGLDSATFWRFAGLRGRVPLIGVAAGYCFAGNAALLGSCDLIIATRDAAIGMAGPAMIEGGGLGVFRPDEVGPAPMHAATGGVDLLLPDDVAAVAAARRALGFFQGGISDWSAPEQRLLRHVIPPSRVRAYDVREVLGQLFDDGSLLELKAGFAPALVTGFARLEGQPVGVLANNPLHLAGAIDAAAAAKAAQFMHLCDAAGLAIVSLCDTPGFMVGPEEERRGMVGHAAAMFAAGARLKVALFTVVLRKAYGLGAMAMAGGSLHRPVFSVAWPTGEFGGMGLEGAVRLAWRNDLAAAAPAERQALFDAKVAELYENGKALNVASYLEIDAVIDPADTRAWLVGGLRSTA